MLATDDEVTYKFFKGSSVHVVLCPRSGGKGHSLLGKQVLIYVLRSTLLVYLIVCAQLIF